jgi:hypothetical protein
MTSSNHVDIGWDGLLGLFIERYGRRHGWAVVVRVLVFSCVSTRMTRNDLVHTYVRTMIQKK